jgi:hypothetical protein
VGKNAKLGIALGIAVLALIALVVLQSLMLAMGIVVLGGIGFAVMLQRTKEADGDTQTGGTRGKAKRGKGKQKLDDYLNREHKAPTAAPAPPRTGGLPAWNPTALDTWQPPSLSEAEVVEEETASNQWDSWDNDWDANSNSDTIVEENPLAELDRLDEIDPVAEIERLDSLTKEESYDSPTGLDSAEEIDKFDFDEAELDLQTDVASAEESDSFSFGSAPGVINEDEIKTADDIMAASEATELTVPVADGGESELARLLAKVQARLSAYE